MLALDRDLPDGARRDAAAVQRRRQVSDRVFLGIVSAEISRLANEASADRDVRGAAHRRRASA